MPWIDEKRLPNGLTRPLTARQIAVAQLLAEGLSVVEIAAQLQISYGVAVAHVGNIAMLLANPTRLKPLALARRWAIAQPDLRKPVAG